MKDTDMRKVFYIHAVPRKNIKSVVAGEKRYDVI